MSLLCVHVPAFKLEVARAEGSGVSPEPPAVLADRLERARVLECNETARAMGVRAGQTVLQARAAAGGAHVLVHDADRSRATWHDMLDALDVVSPLIDDTAEGTAYLDMRGVAGTPDAWIAQTMRALQPFGLPVRAACGENKFLARAYTYAPDRRIDRLALRVLEIEPRAMERLHLLGIRTLGELARLPHGPFVRRFGAAAAVWHDRARGIDPTPFRPRAHELLIDASLYGEGSAAHEEQMLFALRMLADRVCSDLARAGRAAAQLAVTFECENGDVQSIETVFAQATADARTMLDVLRAKLEGVTFAAPVSGLRLQAQRLEEAGTPAALFAQHEVDPQALAVAAARAAAAGARIARARVRPSSRLESRFAYDPFVPVPLQPAARGSTPGTAVPQLRLADVREIAVILNGNTPARVSGRRVRTCAGPWRVEDGWFDDPVSRDEFDVLLEDGALCRIYREGGRWYLRGTYD